jgi:phosphoribosylformylglycinamidine (FGAM) synthase PurS component
VVSGLQSPHGMVFVKTSDDDDSLREQIKDVCHKLLSNH